MCIKVKHLLIVIASLADAHTITSITWCQPRVYNEISYYDYVIKV